MQQDQAHDSAPTTEDRRTVYQVAASVWAHAETVRWSLLYDYLMASTILLLAWATVFAASTPGRGRVLILLVLAAGGAVLSLVWWALVMRDSTFVNMFEDAAADAEMKLIGKPVGGPFECNRRHRGELKGLHKLIKSHVSVRLVCGLFSAIYVFLALLSARWTWLALSQGA